MRNRKDVVAVIKLLNGSGLAARQAKETFRDVSKLVEEFLSVTETVPQDKETQLPPEVLSLYNSLVAELDAAAAAAPAAVQEAPAAVQEAPAAPNTAPPAETVVVMDSTTQTVSEAPAVEENAPIALDEEGFKKVKERIAKQDDSSATHMLDKALLRGNKTLDELYREANESAVRLGQKQFQRGPGDVTAFLNYRTKSGWVIAVTDDGKYKLIGVRPKAA
jgi:hypothetical protein